MEDISFKKRTRVAQQPGDGEADDPRASVHGRPPAPAHVRPSPGPET